MDENVYKVTTIWMDWISVENADHAPAGTLSHDIQKLSHKYGIDLEVRAGLYHSGAGVPWQIRVVNSPHESTKRFILDEYGSNELTEFERMNFVDMHIIPDPQEGNLLAEHRWATGCRVVNTPYGRFQWHEHYHAAGYDYDTDPTTTPEWDRVQEAAVDFLAESGYLPDHGNGRISMAQEWLALAFIACPNLMDHMQVGT